MLRSRGCLRGVAGGRDGGGQQAPGPICGTPGQACPGLPAGPRDLDAGTAGGPGLAGGTLCSPRPAVMRFEGSHSVGHIHILAGLSGSQRKMGSCSIELLMIIKTPSSYPLRRASKDPLPLPCHGNNHPRTALSHGLCPINQRPCSWLCCCCYSSPPSSPGRLPPGPGRPYPPTHPSLHRESLTAVRNPWIG